MTSYVVPPKQNNTQSRKSPEILEQCSSNLAPETYITKETEWHLPCCFHGNTLWEDKLNVAFSSDFWKLCFFATLNFRIVH